MEGFSWFEIVAQVSLRMHGCERSVDLGAYRVEKAGRVEKSLKEDGKDNDHRSVHFVLDEIQLAGSGGVGSCETRQTRVDPKVPGSASNRSN
jgi:hypothetical protein